MIDCLKLILTFLPDLLELKLASPSIMPTNILKLSVFK